MQKVSSCWETLGCWSWLWWSGEVNAEGAGLGRPYFGDGGKQEEVAEKQAAVDETRGRWRRKDSDADARCKITKCWMPGGAQTCK